MARGGERAIALNAGPNLRREQQPLSARATRVGPSAIHLSKTLEPDDAKLLPRVLVRSAHGVGGAAIPIAFRDFSTGCSTEEFFPRRRARALGIAAARRFDSDRVRSLGSFGQAEMLVAWP